MTVLNMNDEIRSASSKVFEQWYTGTELICDVVMKEFPQKSEIFHSRVIDHCLNEVCKRITSYEKDIENEEII